MQKGIAMVGCGYASDFYLANLKNYPELQLIGVFDINVQRLRKTCSYYKVPHFDSFDNLLKNDAVEIVINLTNPAQHYPVSLAALENGKHVYSEKPFAMNMREAYSLIETSKKNNLQFSSAPCTLLGEPAQTAWSIIKEGKIGKPLLVLADLSEGMIHKMLHEKWVSACGVVWPHKDEFETGCVLEHGGYVLSWLTAFFGKIEDITYDTNVIIPNKCENTKVGTDFSCSVLHFENGVIARLTLSIISPQDHKMTIVGEEGVIEISDIWDFDSDVYFYPSASPDSQNPSRYLGHKIKYSLVKGRERPFRYYDSHNIDYMRGVAELASSIENKQKSLLNIEASLHILEAVLVMSDLVKGNGKYKMTTPFSFLEIA